MRIKIFVYVKKYFFTRIKIVIYVQNFFHVKKIFVHLIKIVTLKNVMAVIRHPRVSYFGCDGSWCDGPVKDKTAIIPNLVAMKYLMKH